MQVINHLIQKNHTRITRHTEMMNEIRDVETLTTYAKKADS